jgi:hypothetical protein
MAKATECPRGGTHDWVKPKFKREGKSTTGPAYCSKCGQPQELTRTSKPA